MKLKYTNMLKSFDFAVIMAILLVLVSCKPTNEETIHDMIIIPEPVELIQTPGNFQLNANTQITCDEELRSEAELLASFLRPATGYELPITKIGKRKNVISLVLDNSLINLHQEGYKLDIDAKQVTITANSNLGILYGIQSLRQLFSPEIETKNISTTIDLWTIPTGSIRDYPRFKWRGLMIDCSRTFWNKVYIKRTIRLMSLYKMNVLHLHLTDDQGWRIEIDKYTELTQKGAFFDAKWNEPIERQGFYSKEDIREIVEYAKAHNISVVPEIEMPGHSLAVLACFPELSCAGGPYEIHPFFKGPGVHEDIFCAGNEKTFAFLENVLSEVIELFPSEYIHIGGDEAPKARWEVCAKCQARLKEEGLKDEHELQSWFIKRIEKFLNSKGKKLIGWDEILEGGLSPSATVMFWRAWVKGVHSNLISSGNDIIMSPTSHCYFDYKYEKISTLKAYEYEPVSNGITEEHSNRILGVQANFWSHIDKTEAGVDKQLFPRILSIAEVGWSPKNKRDSTYFKGKVIEHLTRLKKLGVNYYPDPGLQNPE